MYLLPQPKKLTFTEETCYLAYNRKIQISQSCAPESWHHAVLLQKEMEQYAGWRPEIVRGCSACAGVILEVQPADDEESYEIVISQQGVRITGAGTKGLLYGIQTLRQIIRQEGAVLPGMHLWDAPDMKNRGYYHDVTRGRIPTLEYLKHLADTLSFYKMNQLQLYIEHTYLFEGLSEMWRDDTPLTAEDILELDAYCRNLGIDLVPSLSCFGHLYKLLRTKTYSHLCELPDPEKEPFGFYSRMCHHTLNVTDEESMNLVMKLCEEYMALFTSRYFNIGADETFDLGKGASKEEAEKMGTDRLYIDFVKKVCEFVVSKGKIPMFWGDIICSFPQFIHELPKETICLNWGYAPDQSEDSIRKLAQAGAVQYVCPGVSGWNQFINQLEDAYENIRRMCAYGRKYHAVGVLNTDWGDYGHINHPEFSIPGMIYGASLSWNSEELSFQEMNRRISAVEYMDRSEQFVGIGAGMAKNAIFSWQRAVIYQEITELDADVHEWDRKVLEFEPGFEERLTAANHRLEAQKKELALCVRSMDSYVRRKAEAYQIAADGISIFNQIGLALMGKMEKKEILELASWLETWYAQYKKLWRSVSREAELYRISHVMFWYADMLRELAK